MTSEREVYQKNQRKYIALLMVGVALSLFVFCFSLCSGNYQTPFPDVVQAVLHPRQSPQVYSIIFLSRLPRLIGSIFVGAALSVAGLVYQELFSNRMASPDILGVSAGASVGASISIFLGLSFSLTSLFAFVGGIAAVSLTVVVSGLFTKRGSASLILAGIVVGGLMNSLLGLLKYLSNDAQLSTITFWLMGGFYNTNYRQLSIACPIICVGLIALYLMRWKIVMLRGGNADATFHGINAKAVRHTCVAITTVITATSICISGTIGWIGLAIPNLMRLLVHNDGRKLLPLSLVYGALFTELCDLLARSITNTEIPVGIISGLLGAVMFVSVLMIQMKRD